MYLPWASSAPANRRKQLGSRCPIEEADLATWNWPVGDFDAVASIFLHLPPDLRPQIHTQMLTALKPGGLLIIEAFTPAQLQHSSGGPKQAELLYTAEILQKDFATAEVLELLEWKSFWTKAAYTEAAPPWSKASFGNSEARVFLLKLLLEIGELLAQGFRVPF